MSQQQSFDFACWQEAIPFVGWFYEELAAQLFKAQRLSELSVSKRANRSVTDPDLVSKYNLDWVIEVKGGNIKYGVKIGKEQWENFMACIGAGFPYTNLWYAIFSYNLKNISSYKKEGELFQALAGATQRCLLIDYEILQQILIPYHPRHYLNWGQIYHVREDKLIIVEDGTFIKEHPQQGFSFKETIINTTFYGAQIRFKLIGLLKNGLDPTKLLK